MARKPKKPVATLPTKAEVAAGDGQGAKRARKQLQVPGTERKEIPEMTDLAEAVRRTCDERMALQPVEREGRAALMAAVDRLQAAGKLPTARPGEKVTVYAYEDEDGTLRKVVDDYQRKLRVLVDKDSGEDEE